MGRHFTNEEAVEAFKGALLTTGVEVTKGICLGPIKNADGAVRILQNLAKAIEPVLLMEATLREMPVFCADLAPGKSVRQSTYRHNVMVVLNWFRAWRKTVKAGAQRPRGSGATW